MIVVEPQQEAFCSVCGLLVAHEEVDGELWPVEHQAPECGRICIGGGVGDAEYLLATLHRFECEGCEPSPRDD